MSFDFSIWSEAAIILVCVLIPIVLLLVIIMLIIAFREKDFKELFKVLLLSFVSLFTLFFSLNFNFKEQNWENTFVKEYMKQYVVNENAFNYFKIEKEGGFLSEETTYIDVKFNIDGKLIELKKEIEDVTFDEKAESPYITYLKTERDIGKSFKKDEPYFFEIVLPKDYKFNKF